MRTVTSRVCATARTPLALRAITRSPLTRGAIALACGAALFGACNPTAFDDLRDEAGIVVADAPDGYARGGYGSVLASFGGVLGGAQVSRLAASAGADSQTRVYGAWTGSNLQMDPAAFDVCKDSGDCEPGAGESLSGVSSWRGQALCVAAGAPASDLVLVRCEDSPSMSIERVDGASGSRFGAAVAGLPSGDLLVGAPMGGSGGAVFRASAIGGVTEIDLAAVRASGVSRIGARIATAPTAGGGALAAITATGGTQRRVIVAEFDAGGTPTRVSCLDSSYASFGSVVAVGTLVGGDDVPDVVVGDDPALPGRREAVFVYDGAVLLAAGCPAPATPIAPTVTVTCADTRGVACLGSGFGSSIAIGDIDGDHDGDLVVGAPDAAFNGVANSGAVWLFPGNGASVESSGADVLTDSEPETSARLGTSVAVVGTRAIAPRTPSPMPGDYTQRSEVAAGAPGSAEVFVFACSGLSGDGVTAGPRCIPAM